MYVTLKIIPSVFEAVKAAMADSRNSDYYSTPAGASSQPLPADAPAPVVAIADRRAISWLADNSISHGYTVSENGAMYSSSGRNVHGVYRNTDGKYLAFYWGRRSRVGDLIAALQMAGVTTPIGLWVVEYQTEGPADMEWWEDRASYTLRNGDFAIIEAMIGSEWVLGTGQDPKWCWRVWQGIPESRRVELAWIAQKCRAIARNADMAAYRRSAAEKSGGSAS